MPLDRQHLTSGSRMMLPTYLGVFLLLGLEFVLQDPSRTSTPVFDPPKMLWPVPVWGAVFLVIASVEALALIRRHRPLELLGLALGAGMAAFWATLLILAAFLDDRVSFTSGTWLLIPVVAHLASLRSVAMREGSAP